jgi:hypothetical protein
MEYFPPRSPAAAGATQKGKRKTGLRSREEKKERRQREGKEDTERRKSSLEISVVPSLKLGSCKIRKKKLANWRNSLKNTFREKN